MLPSFLRSSSRGVKASALHRQGTSVVHNLTANKPLTITHNSTPPEEATCVAFAVFEDEIGEFGQWDKVLQPLIGHKNFNGRESQVAKTCVPGWQDAGLLELGLVGLGKPDKLDSRKLGKNLASLVRNTKHRSLALNIPSSANVTQVISGLQVALFEDIRWKGTLTEKKDKKSGKIHTELQKVSIIKPDGGSEEEIERAIRLAEGVQITRELVNAPADVADPQGLAETATMLANDLGLECVIMDEAKCKELEMGAFLAVGGCSEREAKFIHLTYCPEKPDAGKLEKVALVGKGVTFDSGGYNIKAGAGSMIELMKFDMAGAAAVLGAAAVIAKEKPRNVEVHFLIAATENMISGKRSGLHPGDIITASNGTTIEVNNTDAEGRLTLCDALLYAQKIGATKIVDCATLTGAIMIALGKDIAGLWGNDENLLAKVEQAAKSSGDKVWRMPLETAYEESLRSNLADMKNAGDRYGGSITAALFLSKFIDEGNKWCHVDLAGPVHKDKTGATGFGVGLLSDLIFLLDEEASK